jgi:hypothetical protein
MIDRVSRDVAGEGRHKPENAAMPPKPAKAPKVETGTLGGLGALGGVDPQIQNSAPPVAALDRAAAIWGEAEAERADTNREVEAFLAGCGAGVPWNSGLASLCPDRPPGSVPAERWRQFIHDCGRLLAAGLIEEAARAGWTAHDLFGCDDTKPCDRNRSDGARLVYKRRPRRQLVDVRGSD